MFAGFGVGRSHRQAMASVEFLSKSMQDFGGNGAEVKRSSGRRAWLLIARFGTVAVTGRPTNPGASSLPTSGEEAPEIFA